MLAPTFAIFKPSRRLSASYFHVTLQQKKKEQAYENEKHRRLATRERRSTHNGSNRHWHSSRDRIHLPVYTLNPSTAKDPTARRIHEEISMYTSESLTR